jgi:hypothetical protein
MLRSVSLFLVFGIAAAYTPDPSGVPTDFICAYREYAAEYAARLVTRANFDQKIVFDALMLGALCNKTFVDPVRSDLDGLPANETENAATIYVSVDGDDTNPGTQDKPMKTVGAGVVATRKLAGPAKTLSVGAGTYYLTSTLVLTDKDENLLITTTGQVWLSGAKPLPAALKWEQYKVAPAVAGALSSHNNTNVQHGCKANDISDPSGCQCYNISSYGASVEQCFDFCKSLGPEGCQSYGWSPGSRSENTGTWSNNCCIRRTDKTWSPGTNPQDQGHVSGHWEGGRPVQNVWKTVLPADTDITTIPQLRIGDSSSSEFRRSPRARHPNANPETDQWPIGYVPNAEWLPPKAVGTPKFINVGNAQLEERGEVNVLNYTGGIGGPCAVFDPPFRYKFVSTRHS